MKLLAYGCALSALVMTSLPASGLAESQREGAAKGACCSRTDTTPRLGVKGLGQEQPEADDVSNDPNWRAYRFERDGFDYLQINDLTGRVHLIIGRADDQFWVLPAGDHRARVSLPLQRLPVSERAQRSEVYLHPEFSLLHYGGEGTLWAVEMPGAASDHGSTAITACCPGDDHHQEIQVLPSIVD